jgi:hypothetical protein
MALCLQCQSLSIMGFCDQYLWLVVGLWVPERYHQMLRECQTVQE